MKKSLIALAAIGTMFNAAPAFAGDVTVNVKYSDLNLASVEGQKTLEFRIDQAAKKACGYKKIHTGSRAGGADAQKCYVDAKKAAKSQIAAVVDDARLGG